MIFNDEPRFSKQLVQAPSDGSIIGMTKSSTEDHVGPGTYLAQQFEERRSGWRKPSFSNRQPMEGPTSGKLTRSDYYTSGVISPNGTMATPVSPVRSHSPGPGYYEGPASVFSFPTSAQRRQDLNLTNMSGASVQNISTRPTNMASTPRFAFSNSVCIKEGVLFQSSSNDQSTVGPGYYSVPRNDFLKRSYNIRARGTDNRVRSASNTPITTPISSPVVKPTTSVRQVSTPRGSYRQSTSSPNPNGTGSANGSVNGSVNGSQNGSVGGGANGRSTTPTSTRPRSASASTPRSDNGSSRPSSARNSISGTSNGSAVKPRTTPAKTAPAPAPSSIVKINGGRGKGLFSEHGGLDKPMTQQQWQDQQAQNQPI